MNIIQKSGKTVLTAIQDVGLILIAIATVFALGAEVLYMFEAKTVTLADLLKRGPGK